MDSAGDAAEQYTPGRSGAAVAMMAERRLETHGAFFRPHLHPGLAVLDAGCGPGTITVGLAAAVAPGPDARHLRTWARESTDAMVAEAWVSAVAVAP